MPLISIIVPVYKVEPYLKPCVDSILAQTFTDIEVILVDDGSPDRCGAICDELAEHDHRIRVIHQENQGLSCARNTGLEAATGDYLCFVDSDDLIAPNYCAELYHTLTTTGCDYSVCSVIRFTDIVPKNAEQHAPHIQTMDSCEFLNLQLNKKSEFGVWNKLFCRDIFDTLRFAPKRLNEDVIFSADLICPPTRRVAVTSAPLYYYRQREGGIVSTQASKGSVDRIYAGEYLLHTVKEHCPKLTNLALRYAVDYPWMFVDPIYVHRAFGENKEYLQCLQHFLQKHIAEYSESELFDAVQLRRMKLFSTSKLLYACNAYARLFRVYLYHLLNKDAYADGHGI